MSKSSKKHILICGERNAGKTTLIEKLIKELDVPVYGFFTRKFKADKEGSYSIHIFSPAETEFKKTAANHVGGSDGRQCRANISAFDNLGVELLRQRPGIVVMDELGVLETGSSRFCNSVLEHLDVDGHVIATIKAKYGVEFLDKVRSHPKAELYNITVENRDSLYNELLPIIRSWNTE